jgi:CHRD domain-containing protein
LSKTNLFGLCLLVWTATFAIADDRGQGQFKADLNGYNEAPSVVTTGSGQVTVTVSSDAKSLSITLDFTKLVGVAQTAGLYLGMPATTGGLIAPICGGTKPACPTTSDGTVTIAIAAADVAAIPAQGLTAGDLASVIQALTNGAVYVNILTNKFATGEIRGQLGRGFGFGNSVGGGRGH